MAAVNMPTLKRLSNIENSTQLSTRDILSQAPIRYKNRVIMAATLISSASSYAISQSVSVLQVGGVIALPTDTVYGLAADLFSPEAVRCVFRVKGRSSGMAIPVLVSDIQDVEMVASSVPPLAWDIANRFWPGPLTLVLKKSPHVPGVLTGGKDSIAIRIPNHPFPLALIKEFGSPITGTSANPTGAPDPTSAEDVIRSLGMMIDLIVDGGTMTTNIPSTVLDLTGPIPTILREGATSLSSLQMFCSGTIETYGGRNI